MISRRTLLQQSAAAVAFGALNQLSARHLWAAPPIELLPDPDEPRLRMLAFTAVDAARAAGAGFADVRLTSLREATVSAQYYRGSGPVMDTPSVQLQVGYGIRTLVDGAWGFASGYELTAEAVRRTAQAAVGLARSNRPRHRDALELAPAPQVPNGRWATPIAQDPFAVPLGEQADVQLAALAAAARVPDIVRGLGRFRWRRFDQVFASSEGSVLIQRLDRAMPSLGVEAMQGEARYSRATASAQSLRSGGYGYEIVADADLTAELREAAEQAVAESKTLRPPRSVDVGRYDLVIAPRIVAYLLGDTLGRALDLERVLRYRANSVGTSFAAPPEEILGTYQVAAPRITLRADRSQPHGWSTVGWDDEGVAPEEYPVIQDGVIVDYHTNRQTAPALAAWYRQRGEPVRSRGCALGIGQGFPRVVAPNLTLEPGPGDTSEADLIADTERGIYVRGYDRGGSDPQLLSGQYNATYSHDIWEIRNGKRGDRLSDFGFQFITPQFWKGVDALGGAASAEAGSWYDDHRWSATQGGLQLLRTSVSAVPLRVRQVNVLNLGRTQ